jgi:hypothetical protein
VTPMSEKASSREEGAEVFTPGEWRACVIENGQDDDYEQWSVSDARLIAAAPALLKAIIPFALAAGDFAADIDGAVIADTRTGSLTVAQFRDAARAMLVAFGADLSPDTSDSQTVPDGTGERR